MKRTLLSFAFMSVFVGAIPTAAVASPQYTVKALTIPGASFTPTGITNGLIVGNAQSDAGLQATIWYPAGPQALQGPDGATVLGVSSVNRFGDATGTAGAGRGAPRGLVWRGGIAEFLPNEDDDADETEYLYGSRAVGINGSGAVVGNAETEYGTVGVVWDGTGLRLLMSLDPITEYQSSVANSINELGQVAGSADQNGRGQAVVWENGVIRQIGGLGEHSSAADINDLGASVGWTVNASDGTSAFLNDGVTTTLLPTLAGFVYSDASAINNAGLIVGYSAPEGVEEGAATLWENGQAYDLNALLGPNAAGWDLISAVDIGNDGTIVGFGRYNGEYTGFVLTPVPEPFTLVTLSAALTPLLLRRRRSR